MDRWAGKVAVVTGASAGIGLATAKALVQNGMIVIGLSRRLEKMQTDMSSATGPGKFYAKACDVTKERDIVEAFQWIEKNFKTVHILINNAGTFRSGSILDIKSEEMENLIKINVLGLLHCTRQALKLMKKNDHEAHIVNINSLVGHKIPKFGVPMNVYPATKYAVTAISETLVNELEGSKIRVTSISPGVVKTEIFDLANIDPKFVKAKPALNAEDVANSILYAISAPPHVQIMELIISPLGAVY